MEAKREVYHEAKKSTKSNSTSHVAWASCPSFFLLKGMFGRDARATTQACHLEIRFVCFRPLPSRRLGGVVSCAIAAGVAHRARSDPHGWAFGTFTLSAVCACVGLLGLVWGAAQLSRGL